jgi:uncharacterized membrane protein
MENRYFGFSDWMLISIILWLCLMPVVLFLAAPVIGATGAWLTVGFLLVLFLGVCWVACKKMLQRDL